MAKREGEPCRLNICDKCGDLVTMDEERVVKYMHYFRDIDKYPGTNSNHSVKTDRSIKLCANCFSIVSRSIDKWLVKS